MLLALLSLPLAGSPAAPRAQEPFPTESTVTLREDGKLWHVRGRRTIASSVKIVSLRSARIQGLDGEAVLEVSGVLELKAVTGGGVTLENVWIELAPDCKALYLSQCWFKGGGVRSSEKGPTQAKVFIERSYFQEGASFSVSMSGGSIDVQGASSAEEILLRGLPQSEKVENKTSATFLSCKLAKGLQVVGVLELLVRNCDLAGDAVTLLDCPRLHFDGNNVRTERMMLAHSEPGRFAKTKVGNCDFRCDVIELRAPPRGDKSEPVLFDHCWFRGRIEPLVIRRELILDQLRDPTSAAVASFRKTSAAALGLGGRNDR